MHLKEAFAKSYSHYTEDELLCKRLWSEIDRAYSGKGRHYHTLQHLDDLLNQMTDIRDKIVDWDLIVFAIAYHDIVYSVSSHDNEEKSARIAAERLSSFLDRFHIEKCKARIIATKTHLPVSDSDTNYFTDADLAIFGSNTGRYVEYTKLIRAEYSMYPGIIYDAGRKKVIQHFLKMDRIYKTDWFYEKFESIARYNLSAELKLLV